MSDYYDMDGNPISMRQWARLLDGPDAPNRHIADDYIATRDHPIIRISTVWMGLNHNFWGGVPLIFETMVFGLEELPEELEIQMRWPTKEAALAGHDQVVAMIQEALSKR